MKVFENENQENNYFFAEEENSFSNRSRITNKDVIEIE